MRVGRSIRKHYDEGFRGQMDILQILKLMIIFAIDMITGGGHGCKKSIC